MFLQAEIMTGVQSVDLSNVQQIADKLLAKGCNTIIITLGPLGVAFASQTNRNVTHIPTAEVQPVDTTVRITYRFIAPESLSCLSEKQTFITDNHVPW